MKTGELQSKPTCLTTPYTANILTKTTGKIIYLNKTSCTNYLNCDKYYRINFKHKALIYYENYSHPIYNDCSIMGSR